ncbi:MAG: prenyltransferase [Zoogloeaceae bacterium]|nr:prenyltransferase [Zoogloeaceae bacterium]
MAFVEPVRAHFANPLWRYLSATRLPFLSITFVACLIGLACASASGIAINPATAWLTLFFALVTHAGVNVLNDYYDFCNGADAHNEERLYPFTGGSRFIVNGVLSEREMKVFGYSLLLSTIPAGVLLMWFSASGLFWIGCFGLFVAVAYSAPPLQLVSRGLGEPAILAGWLLIAVGADFVQRGAFSAFPWGAGLPFALLVVNILYINQFPDRKSDAAVGKRTVIVRLGTKAARWGYLWIALFAYIWLLFAVLADWVPAFAAAGILALPISLAAARDLIRYADKPGALRPAVLNTILAAHVSGLLTALGLRLSA